MNPGLIGGPGRVAVVSKGIKLSENRERLQPAGLLLLTRFGR